MTGAATAAAVAVAAQLLGERPARAPRSAARCGLPLRRTCATTVSPSRSIVLAIGQPQHAVVAPAADDRRRARASS